MPPGVRIVSYYDRTQLIDATLHTVTHSVRLGITLVVLVLIFFLGRPAMALLVALTIPFSLLFAMVLMYLTNIPIGLLVDRRHRFRHHRGWRGHHGREHRPPARRIGPARSARDVWPIIRGAALDMQRPVFISVLLIMVAFLPLLSLTRIEGLLFRPMAMTILFALLGALIFALILVPVLATFLFRHGYKEWENPLLHWFTPVYIHSVRIAAQGALARRHAVRRRPGAGAVRAGAAAGDGVLALPGRRRALGPRRISRKARRWSRPASTAAAFARSPWNSPTSSSPSCRPAATTTAPIRSRPAASR